MHQNQDATGLKTTKLRRTSHTNERAQLLHSPEYDEDFVWLNEIQKVLSPYWAARPDSLSRT